MSEQAAARHQRSAAGMVGAMIVLFVVVLAWVAVRAVSTPEPARQVQTIDYQRVVPAARKAAPFHLVAPPSLPRGWRATHGGLHRECRRALAPRGAHRRGSLRRARAGQRSRCAPWSPSTSTRQPTARRARSTSPGVPWATYTDSGGDLALVRHQGRTTTLVVGHDVARATLRVLRRRACADGSTRGRRPRRRRPRRRAAAWRRRATPGRSCASFSPRSHSASDSSRSVPPGLQPADHLDQLLAGLLVARLVLAHASVSSRAARVGSVPVASTAVRRCAPMRPSATRTLQRPGRRRPGRRW